VPARLAEPELNLVRRDGLPYLVEHWYLGPRARRHIMVRRFREVLEQADLRPGLRVLDVGCGWAYGTHWARTLGCRACGIDLAPDQVTWARAMLEDGTRLELAQADAKALPFAARSFDRVFSVEALEHVFRPDRPALYAELARVLKPGGKLVLSTPNYSSPIEAVKRLAVRWPALRRRLPAACFAEAGDDPVSYHPYRYHHPPRPAELRRGLVRAGFEVLGTRRFLWVPRTLPDGLLGVARLAERVLESLPLVRRLGATTLVWAVRH